MSFAVRDGRFDVVIAASPGVALWPSAGVRALSSLCADMGLTVGAIGGESLKVRGVVPLRGGLGALVLAEDVQNRIHRISARAVVRLSDSSAFPPPFEGWRSQALIPLQTARRLRKEARLQWGPCTAVLGTGNAALRFASSLLESGVPEVICVESNADWGSKRIAGWEVERRRFESRGGRIIEARPLRLTPKAPLLWEFRLEDSQGVRILEVARVVSAGPFFDLPGLRQYPRDSLLFELEQTAPLRRSEDVDGWSLEEERGRWIATRIVKALVSDVGPRREELERIQKRARLRLKRHHKHREEPFAPSYQGKWMASADARAIREFSGTPKKAHQARLVASIECFESVACNLCEQACPEEAIDLSRGEAPVLSEADCTACGLCLPACPSGATLMIQEKENESMAKLVLPWRGDRAWKVGEYAGIVNRRGDVLGSGRVTALLQAPENTAEPGFQLVQLDVPAHLAWEARGLRQTRSQAAQESSQAYISSLSEKETERVEITLNGDRRLVRPGISISLALFETGQGRAEDALLCPDGSCRLCQVLVDGVKKLACETEIHRGMAIRTDGPTEPWSEGQGLCPCLGIEQDDVIRRVTQGALQSPEAAVAACHLGEGRCHGRICREGFRGTLLALGIDASQWIDWRFPWSEWVLSSGPSS